MTMDTPEIHNLKDFMTMLGQYDQAELGDKGFILDIFQTKKKGKQHIADFNQYVERFHGYNPHTDHHLLYWLQEEAQELLQPNRSYVVAACVPETLEPVAHTLITIPKVEELPVVTRPTSTQTEEQAMLQNVFRSLQTAVVRKMTEGVERVFEPTPTPTPTVHGTPVAITEDEEEQADMGDDYIELDNGTLLPQKKALQMLLNQQMKDQSPEPEKESGGLPSIMSLISTLGPQLQPLLGGLFKNLFQGSAAPAPPPPPTVGMYPPYGYPPQAPPGYPHHPNGYMQGQAPPMPLQPQVPMAPPPAPVDRMSRLPFPRSVKLTLASPETSVNISTIGPVTPASISVTPVPVGASLTSEIEATVPDNITGTEY